MVTENGLSWRKRKGLLPRLSASTRQHVKSTLKSPQLVQCECQFSCHGKVAPHNHVFSRCYDESTSREAFFHWSTSSLNRAILLTACCGLLLPTYVPPHHIIICTLPTCFCHCLRSLRSNPDRDLLDLNPPSHISLLPWQISTGQDQRLSKARRSSCSVGTYPCIRSWDMTGFCR